MILDRARTSIILIAESSQFPVETCSSMLVMVSPASFRSDGTESRKTDLINPVLLALPLEGLLLDGNIRAKMSRRDSSAR